MKNIQIEPMTQERVESWNAAIGEVAQERIYILSTEAPTLDSSIQFVRDCVESKAPVFVALDEDQIVGWCDVIPFKRATIDHVGRLGMGVLPGRPRWTPDMTRSHPALPWTAFAVRASPRSVLPPPASWQAWKT